MNKKNYMKPTMNVVHVQMSQMLCVSGVNTNLDDDDQITIGGPGDGPALAPGFGIGLLDDWGK